MSRIPHEVLRQLGVTEAEALMARRDFDSAVSKGDAVKAHGLTRTPAFQAAMAMEAAEIVGENYSVPTKLTAAVLLTKAANLVQSAIGRTHQKRIQSLEARLEQLEHRVNTGPFKYMGGYTEGLSYEKGTFVTHQGSLWHCNTPTRSKPGTGWEWTLAAKRGADGRNAR